MKKFNYQFYGSHVGRMNYGGAKFCRFALFPLMLLMLLFVPTRMVAQTTTEDPRYALFNGLDGINNVTITDNDDHPWQMLDLNAEGMTNLGFTIPDGSKGLMSSNYHVDGSSSETVVNFTVEKPMLLTFKYLVSSEYNFDKATITLDNKEPWTISDKKQIEIKALLSVGEHSLKLSYTKDVSGNENADRTCIYDLKTATTFSEYVADYVATNSTLTFKKITSDNLEGLDLSRLAMVDNIDGVQDVCTNYSSIKNIVFDESFKTYAPTSLREFFKGCETLETISDLEYLNTAKVTDMGKMFHGCSALTSLDLTNFNTANVEFMDNMFEGCSALESLNLTNFNTAKVTYMSCMFKGCSALESLNLTNFNTENVTDMSWMFYGCSALKSLDLTNFNTAKVTHMIHMFYGCSALKSLDLTNFNTAKVEYINDMFSGCSALTTIYVSDKFVTTKVINGSDMFTGCEKLKGYNDSKTDHTFANGYFTPVFDYAEFATGTLTFRRSLSKPAGAYDLNEGNNEPGWLTQKENIYKVVFDASFAKARPTSCYKWFWSCDVTQIEGIENLNTEEVTNMHSMFSGCLYLTSLDVSKFDTQKVEDMSDMFASCTDLESLNVSNFDTQKVKDMNDMFYNCTGLTSLDVSNFNTQNVEDMSFMFSSCFGLTSLDLSNFDTKEVTNMSNMFWNSSALKTIYVSDKFVTAKVTKSNNMFSGCKSLKGFIEQNKNTDKIDHNYANYKTGYFSKLVGKNGSEKIGAAGETLATDNLVLADDKDFVAYEPFTATAASYNRTMKEGTTWATLCLPFEVSLDGQNFRAFKLLSANEGSETVELEELKTIEAGTPVVIKMKDGETLLDFNVANKNIAKDVLTSATADGNYQLQGLYTQKTFSKDADNNCYIVKGDKLMNPAKLLDKTTTEHVGSKPFRAYMVDKSPAPSAGARMFSISIGGSTTAIKQLETTADSKAEYYDLQGRRLQDLQKGVNIVKRGGKTMKVIIK